MRYSRGAQCQSIWHAVGPSGCWACTTVCSRYTQKDFARVRWALEQMVEKQIVNKVLGTVVVRAEPVPGEGGFKDLQRVERDADIDAVVLAIYRYKPHGGR